MENTSTAFVSCINNNSNLFSLFFVAVSTALIDCSLYKLYRKGCDSCLVIAQTKYAHNLFLINGIVLLNRFFLVTKKTSRDKVTCLYAAIVTNINANVTKIAAKRNTNGKCNDIYEN